MKDRSANSITNPGQVALQVTTIGACLAGGIVAQGATGYIGASVLGLFFDGFNATDAFYTGLSGAATVDLGIITATIMDPILFLKIINSLPESFLIYGVLAAVSGTCIQHHLLEAPAMSLAQSIVSQGVGNMGASYVLNKCLNQDVFSFFRNWNSASPVHLVNKTNLNVNDSDDYQSNCNTEEELIAKM